ncbi:MAG: NAD(P)-dependent oxidoreductase [Anaerolineales bacterium]
MKLAIFGGTGKTGQHLVKQALNAGHAVTALARTPSKLALNNDKLHVVQGDILDANCVAETIQGVDAVLSVLGPSDNKPTFTISQGMDHILAAMQQHGVQRLIISAGAGVRDPQDKPGMIDKVASIALNILSKNVAADMKQVVEKVRASDTQWTIVRVPMLTDKPAQGTLKVGYVGDITPQISREDMAQFMLDQVANETYIRKAPAISN